MDYLNLGDKTGVKIVDLDAVYFDNLFKQRVIADGGVIEAENCLVNQINILL